MKTLTNIAATLFFMLMLALLLFACNNNESEKIPEKVFDAGFVKMKTIPNSGITVTTIDTCQYIILAGINEYAIIHKQNCNNPNHEK